MHQNEIFGSLCHIFNQFDPQNFLKIIKIVISYTKLVITTTKTTAQKLEYFFKVKKRQRSTAADLI